MLDGPLLSVCIPLWNEERYIGEALYSVLNQTYKNLEVIISNNASNDKSIEIINSFNDSRVKIITNPENIGGLNNFIKVFSYATGKYMSYLSADDKVELDAYEKAVTILEDKNNSDIVLVNSHIEIIDDRSEHVFTKKYLFGSGRISSYWGIRSNFIYGSNIIGEPNGSVWRKDAFDKMALPKFKNSNGWTADLDLKMELLLQGNTYVIPEPLGKFRVSGGTNSSTIFSSQSRLFRQYVYTLYKDKRYHLSFGWVVLASITSIVLELARKLFYILFITKKGGKRNDIK
ncbi:MAG: glycosyltransferase family 2 protein [Bacteroidetes bacterium]|nr:glycosyltransferase family 2 protein [Bacteroidota bacterium]